MSKKTSKEFLNKLLDDIEVYSLRIMLYSKDIDFDEFVSDYLRQDAILRNISVIGEVATRITKFYPDFIALTDDVLPWHQIVSMRNRVVHAYDQVSEEILWDTTIEYIPELVEKILPQLRLLTKNLNFDDIEKT